MQKGREDWWDSIEKQAHAWETPPGIAFKPFFPAQPLMATNSPWRSGRREQLLLPLSQGNNLHGLTAPAPDPVPTDGSPCTIDPTDRGPRSFSLTWGTGEGQETTHGTHPTGTIPARPSSQALLPQETALTIFLRRTEHQ